MDNEDVTLAVKRVKRTSISSQMGTSMFLNSTELEPLGIEDESITEANRVHAENDSSDDLDGAAVHHHHHHHHHHHADGLSSSSEEEEEEEEEGEKEHGGGSGKERGEEL